MASWRCRRRVPPNKGRRWPRTSSAETGVCGAHHFIDRVPTGASVLVIEGPPGMGKTTLWLAGLEDADHRAWRILSARPTEAEATFAYAGLTDLLEVGLRGCPAAAVGSPATRAGGSATAPTTRREGARPGRGRDRVPQLASGPVPGRTRPRCGRRHPMVRPTVGRRPRLRDPPASRRADRGLAGTSGRGTQAPAAGLGSPSRQREDRTSRG